MTQSDRNWVSGQAHPDLVLVGDPVLRGGGREVTDLTDIGPLVERLVSLLRQLNGAGLAAPQIGVALAVVVVEVRKTDVFPDRPESPLMRMVNPKIEWLSDDMEHGWEGCFSIPGVMGLVPRSTRIEVAYRDPDGTARTQRCEGYLARVVQHEVDHLNGVLFVDRMPSMDSLTTVVNYQRFHAPQPAAPDG
jgi:peptide deformylase